MTLTPRTGRHKLPSRWSVINTLGTIIHGCLLPVASFLILVAQSEESDEKKKALTRRPCRR